MKESEEATDNALRKRGLLLVWVGEAWNGLEAAVALWSGLVAGSVALLTFGLDSLIEIFAGFVLIWRLGREWKGGKEQVAEIKALRLVGASFFLLAVYVLFQASATLLGWFPEPKESLAGILMVVASAVVMTWLYFGKVRIAKKLESRALRAEAIESLVCDLQDLTVLVGLGLNTVMGWWWADPIAALALIPLLVKEGLEAISTREER